MFENNTKTYSFWCDLEEAKELLFTEEEPAYFDEKYIVAGIENDKYSVEVNVFRYDLEERKNYFRNGWLQYYVCHQKDGEWGSLCELNELKLYPGFLEPSIWMDTTEEDLEKDLAEILEKVTQALA